jgi:hypothetical protein
MKTRAADSSELTLLRVSGSSSHDMLDNWVKLEVDLPVRECLGLFSLFDDAKERGVACQLRCLKTRHEQNPDVFLFNYWC